MQLRRLLYLGGLVAVQAASAQVTFPTLQWQRTFGGASEDELHCAVATPDGGLLIGGYSMSSTNDGKTALNFGLVNFWVVRVDSSGNRLWDKTYGGNAAEYLFAAAATTDGGFILGGPSRSLPSGNKTAPWHGTNSTVNADYWIVRIDRDGNKLWDQSFGGVADDQLYDVRQTRDGGFILAGYSRSPASGNKSDAGFGNYDYWLVRTDRAGNKLWDRCYGGTDDDRLFSVAETEEGGFVLAGFSNSGTNGNKTAPSLPASNCWIIRTDSQGNPLWDKCLQGRTVVRIAVIAPDDYALGADVPSSKYRLYRIDSNGTVKSFRDYGDTVSLTHLATLDDSGFLLAGYSRFLGGTNSDYYVVRTDRDGNQLWDLSFGGSNHDHLRTAVQTADSGFFLGGFSRSDADGNKTAPALGGFPDYWAIKVSPDCVRLRAGSAAPQTNTPVTFWLSAPADNYVIEYSDNLEAWTPFATNAVAGSSVSITPLVEPAPRRFFRARSTP